MKVLELFSGIGGMHLALKECGIEAEVVAAFDINTIAVEVYKHNFPNTPVYNRNIQSLTPEFVNQLAIDVILMSPPCQPFTRNGLKRDISDTRSNPFIHILSILNEINVNYILVENVKGFETSTLRQRFIDSLTKCGFTHQEFILSPTQFGIPNSRRRYYCLAKRGSTFKFSVESLREDVPIMYSHEYETCKIKSILEDNTISKFNIPDNILQKQAKVLDICYFDSVRSCCFTKSYGRYVKGTGSVYAPTTKQDVDDVYVKLNNYTSDSEDYLNCIKRLNLRFFTPREVCRLMCFPEDFNFPADISDKQKYMLLGNSINVKVVSELIKMLID